MFLRTKYHSGLDCIKGYLLFTGFALTFNTRNRKSSDKDQNITVEQPAST